MYTCIFLSAKKLGTAAIKPYIPYLWEKADAHAGRIIQPQQKSKCKMYVCNNLQANVIILWEKQR